LDVDPWVQLQLLDLQALDSGIDRLATRRKTLPELADITRLTDRLRALGNELADAERERHDSARAQIRLETDVEQVRSRAARDQTRMDTGNIISSKELESLQSEIASLKRRRDVLEDELLELMETAEAAAARADELSAERDKLEGEKAEAIAGRDAAWIEIDEQTVRDQEERTQLAATLPVDLVTLYERLRKNNNGVGAAKLYRRRCEGCHLELSGSDWNDVVDAPVSLVLRCEECRRILIRTADSGL
jgi:predicted  nucleic acid-binding Zn-ribbon protein